MFQPNDHLIKLKGKEYLTVQFRLVWFRDQYPHGTITTEMMHLDLEKGIAIFKAVVSDGQGGTGVGHGSESAADFGDFLEKAETKSIGRALATLGFGTQFAPELEEGDRIVDSPVAPQNGKTAYNRPQLASPAREAKESTPSTKSLGFGTGQQPVPSGEQGKRTNGQHPYTDRLNALYVKAREGKHLRARKGAEQADFLSWIGSLFPDRQVTTAQDISLEMIEYLEVQIAEAAHD